MTVDGYVGCLKHQDKQINISAKLCLAYTSRYKLWYLVFDLILLGKDQLYFYILFAVVILL